MTKPRHLRVLPVLFGLGIAVLSAGCVVNASESPARGVIVSGPPPAPVREEAPPPPGPAPDMSHQNNAQFPEALPGPLPKIQLRIEDQDIRSAFDVLASQAGLNILVAPNVSGRVTLNLKDVTFEQAFDVLQKQANVASRREGNIIYVYTVEDMAAMEQKGRKMQMRVFCLNYARASDVALLIRPFISREGSLSLTPSSGGAGNVGFGPGGGGVAGLSSGGGAGTTKSAADSAWAFSSSPSGSFSTWSMR